MVTVASCSAPKNFIQVSTDSGRKRIIFPPGKTCFLVELDSIRSDPFQIQLFRIETDCTGTIASGSSWLVTSIDTSEKKINFKNCGSDSLEASLKTESIRYLIPYGRDLSAADALDIVALPAFILGTVGMSWGLISLPFPSTPSQDDVKLLSGGVAALGVFGVAVWLKNSLRADTTENRYKIVSLH